MLKSRAPLILFAGVILASGCTDSLFSEDPDCTTLHPLSDACVGVIRRAICSDPFCTEQASCADITYVLAGAAPGGDGSESQPLPDLAAATLAAGPGDCVALGEGTYGPVRLPPGVSLRKQCYTT